MVINGEWRTTSETIDVINPAIGEKEFEVYSGGKKDVIDAIQAAQQAFPAWAERPAIEREEETFGLSLR